jgi:5'-methylthioadenosine phosphorylase/5'-methylthioinosine phosphorylase
MTRLAIIGGSGLTALEGLVIRRQQMQPTPWGEPSGPLMFGLLHEKEVVFLPRHGNPHAIPPHQINYRANLWALKENGIANIIAVNAVGGITRAMHPGRLAIPSQIIDYTSGRQHTYFGEKLESVVHVDFTNPYSDYLRRALLTAGMNAQLDVYDGGTYGATQGPRLETAAEIARMEKDGCDLVGMTGMPEAALARELGLDYAAICIVVNWAAGKTEGVITMDVIEKFLATGITMTRKLLEAAIPDI